MCVRTYVGVCFKDSGHFRLLFEGYKTLLASILALLEATYEPGLRTFLKGTIMVMAWGCGRQCIATCISVQVCGGLHPSSGTHLTQCTILKLFLVQTLCCIVTHISRYHGKCGISL